MFRTKQLWSVSVFDSEDSWHVSASSPEGAAAAVAKHIGAADVTAVDEVCFVATKKDPTGFFGGDTEVTMYVHLAPKPLEGV